MKANFKEIVGVCALSVLLLSPDVASSAPEITVLTADQGIGVRSIVNVSGTGFGDKTQSTPVLYDFGDFAYENGVRNDHQSSFSEVARISRANADPDSLWYKPSSQGPILTRESARHPYSARAYRHDAGNNFLGWPQAYGGQSTPVNNEQLYVSWWYKNDVEQRQYFEAGYTDKQGVFEVGEQIRIAGHPDLEAYILGDRESYTGENKLAFRVEVLSSNSMLSSAMQGITLTGEQSGASVTLNSDYRNGGYWMPRGGSNKFIRIWEEIVGNVGLRLSWTQDQLTVAQTGSTANIVNHMDTALIANQWHHLEILVDLEQNEVIRWVNSKEIDRFDISKARRLDGASPTIALLGFNGKQYFNAGDSSDIYMDISPQRVMLGNASSWDDVTHAELQRPIAWSSTSIQFETFLGGLSSKDSLYLYVVDANGNINSEGYLFVKEKSAAAPPPSFRYIR
jgi:hypothetical protein